MPSGTQAFPGYFALYSAHFVAYGAILWLLRSASPKVLWIILIALLGRVILMPTAPILENDYWRYLWDGRVFANGINPYAFKPLDHALDHLDVFYRQQIGWKQYGTIYPPVSIGIFALAHLIVPDSILVLKIILTIFEFATGLVLIFWFQDMKIPLKWTSIYLLSPLVVKEIANSAHLDSIAVFFTTLSVFLLWKNGRSAHQRCWVSLVSWILLALAVASKLYPICLLLLFFKIDRYRWRGLGIFIMSLVLIYTPFLSTGYSFFNGTEAFAKHWIFNASIYKVIQKGISTLFLYLESSKFLSEQYVRIALENDFLAKGIVGSIFSAYVYFRTKKLTQIDELPKEVLNVLGVLLILSPVVNGWYLLWLFPFACLSRSKPWLIFSYLIVAGYAWWYSNELSLYLKWIEYIILFLFFYICRNSSQKKIAVETNV